jgi:drug/metabolite transporter (DMT)-like permease
MSRPALVSLIIAVLFWGSAPVGTRAGLTGYAPAELTLFRFGLGSIVLGIYGLVAGLRAPRWRDLPLLIVAGGLGITFYNVVLNYGLLTVSAGAASFLIASTPIWTSLLAVIFLREKLTVWGWSGIFLSFLGIALIARERGQGIHFAPGALVILVGAISYGGYMVLQKRLLGTYPALEFTCYSFWAGTLLTLPLGWGLWHSLHSAPRSATLAIVYLGIFPAAVANLAWAYGMAHTTASRVSSFLYLMPLATLVIAWVWLGEVPTVFSIVGGAIALAGVAIVNVWGHAPVSTALLVPEVIE